MNNIMASLLKWRKNLSTEFQVFSVVSEEFLKRYIGPISHPFLPLSVILAPNCPNLNGSITSRSIVHVLKENDVFYFIEGGSIIISETKYTSRLIRNVVITHWRIGNGEWQSVFELHFDDKYCIVDKNLTYFVRIGGQNSLLTLTDESEISAKSLKDVAMVDLLYYFNAVLFQSNHATLQ